MLSTNIFIQPENEPGTFDKDETLPPLPLPKLEDTMKRYFESLRPFGTEEELKHSRRLIDEFLKSEGPKLQALLEKKAKSTRNWVEQWWEDYAYLSARTPLMPWCNMVTTVPGPAMNLPETKDHFLKSAALFTFSSLRSWSLLRDERFKPMTSPSGKYFSCHLFKNIFNTVRLPGKEIDEIKSYFKVKSQGNCPFHIVIAGRGRFFVIEALNPDGSTLSLQQIYRNLQLINSALLEEEPKDSVAFLTQDERHVWAENRQKLQELTPQNKETLRLIESAMFIISIDDKEPSTYSELMSWSIAGGDCIWADKSCTTSIHRNGKVGFFGEHSCFDGSFSGMINLFTILTIAEREEVDWDVEVKVAIPKEIKFDLNECLLKEINRMKATYEINKTAVGVVVHSYQKFGKEYMKNCKIHPDAFIQTVIQLTYYALHSKVGSVYETATMREYYHGRTETVRSCNMKMVEVCKAFHDPNASSKTKWTLFKEAADSQMHLMTTAREGKGVDRHLFGFYCIALENNLPIPKIFTEDPLSVRSGGGGNFVLSTSTLGYTISMGMVAPMIEHGYGVFYSMLQDNCWFMISTYKKSTETSGEKFRAKFDETMDELKNIYENLRDSKL